MKTRKVELINPNRLILDPDNPRLSVDQEGSSQEALIRIMIEEFDLIELAESITSSGYLPFEPLLVVRQGENYKVKEGNRRVAAVKLLLDPGIAPERHRPGWATLSKDLTPDTRTSLRALPALVFSEERDKDLISYMANRHVAGTLKWPALEKAAYVADLVALKWSIEEIAKKLGSKPAYVRQHFLAYNLARQARKKKIPGFRNMEDAFGVLLRSLQSPDILSYLGISGSGSFSKEPIARSGLGKFADFVQWTFGTDEKPSLLKDSRDITKWGKILQSTASIEYLRGHPRPTLERAWRLSGGEIESVGEALSSIAERLEEYAVRAKTQKTDKRVQKIINRIAFAVADILRDFPQAARENGIQLKNAASAD